MSADQVAALLAAVAADEQVAARFAGATSVDEAVAVANDLGFAVTAQELAAAAAQSPQGELSDAELGGAAGGGSPSLDPMLCPTGRCQSLYGLGCG